MAAQTCDGLVARVVGSVSSPTLDVLYGLDEMSETLCRVLDSMELCRNVHPDPAWAEAANDAYVQLSAHMQTLNTEPRLYEAVDALLQAPRLRASLTPEQLRFAQSMAAEFQHDGVHLSPERRARLCRLHGEAEQLSVRFAAGPGGEAQLTLLQQLLERRHEIAHELGHDSWAKYTLSHQRMERDPAHVREALLRLLGRLQPLAAAELAALSGGAAAAAPPVGEHEGLRRLLGAQRAAAAAREADEAAMAPYLQVDRCLDGLEMVLRTAFGLRLLRAAAAEDELWHPTVRKLLLVRAPPSDASAPAAAAAAAAPTRGGEAVGVLYLDLFRRPHKSRQPALYTLRAAAARPTPAAAAAAAHHAALQPPGEVARRPALQLGLPAAALVCDLPADDSEGCEPRTGKATLRPSQLETLYHEAGHALHALLSRTEFQHLAGVRAPLDFVETPSLLMENFARHPTVLAAWAAHARTGAPLAREEAAQLCAARPTLEAVEWQGQAVRALLDLELHSDARHAPPARSAALARALTARHTALPAEAGAAYLAGFGHLASYGAGYYSYLWARALSRRVWRDCFEADPLRPAAAARWCDEVLRHGGAREPRQMLRELLAQGGAARSEARPGEGEAEAALLELVEIDLEEGTGTPGWH